MDIIDVMLARALTPQGQVDTYAARAQKAAQNASAAAASAEAAVENIESITEQTNANNQAAADALETVQAALQALEEAGQRIDLDDVDDEVNKITLNVSSTSNSNIYSQNITATMPDGTTTKTATGIGKLYKTTGTNEDGSMTQKAITNALNSNTTNLGSENSGKIVIVGANGEITAGSYTENNFQPNQQQEPSYTAQDSVGLDVDYVNKSFTRTQQAVNKIQGNDFNNYIMYGGRRRCNVSDDGTINAFYGDNGYTENGSNGQVMVYQPKFYYRRVPITMIDNTVGKIIQKDSFIISATNQTGFKIHPLFVNNAGEELDYVLLSAYEGGLYDVSASKYINNSATNVDFNSDKLSSVSGIKPITGSSELDFTRAEKLATNRGTGWHIQTIEAESANQMLEIIEFGTMNGQSALGKGICYIAKAGEFNQAALTGSTASLGNNSGAATETIIENNGTQTTETTDGKVAISYRGVENPWGNVWQMIGGILVSGNGSVNGGIPYICTNYTYSYTNLTDNYVSAEFSLPNTSSWISALGYGSSTYDWLLMPAACTNANSALPIGDNGWFTANLNGIRMVVQGGGWSFEESDGLFYYACDHTPQDSSYRSYGARLLYIPTKNNIYTANIAKWQQEMNIGG